MVSLDWNMTRNGGVTLVELLVTSEIAARVHVESRLEPVWPPRRQGVPAAGWNRTKFEGTVGSDSRLAFGYASPAQPQEPPAEIVSTEPVDERTEPTAREIVRTLGEPGPPRDAVPFDDGELAEPTEWLDAVEKRLATARELDGAGDAQEVRDVVDALGGIEAVRTLRERLEEDRRRLDRIQRRTSRVADRLDAVEIPLATLERIA